MSTQWGCIDGAYVYYANTIMIHLGDDNGQGDQAFCLTALDHELDHHFLRIIRNKCWFSEAGSCSQYYPSAYGVGGPLCHTIVELSPKQKIAQDL